VFCLSCIPYLYVLHGCVYIVEIVPKVNLDNVCNEFMFITRAYIVGEFSLYILVLLTSIAFVVVVWVEPVLIWASSFVLLDHIKYNLLYTTYSRISCVLVTNIHYINPLIVVVINYQNGGDCKGTLPLCVVLVINDNPYGLMFSLSLYEGIFHRYYLFSMCWIQVWMPWR
jgi:hypothetical protein